jgi:hypothetical protein
VGALVLARVQQGRISEGELRGWLDEALTRADDRALFGLGGCRGREVRDDRVPRGRPGGRGGAVERRMDGCANLRVMPNYSWLTGWRAEGKRWSTLLPSPEISMSWRLYQPRPISIYEAKIVRRVLDVSAEAPLSNTLLASIEDLIVRDEGDGVFHHDSLDFGTRGGPGRIIGHAIGTMANDCPVELLVWAKDSRISALELEPYEGSRLPIRMPILESIRPYPYENPDLDPDDDDEDD